MGDDGSAHYLKYTEVGYPWRNIGDLQAEIKRVEAAIAQAADLAFLMALPGMEGCKQLT